MRVIKIKNCQEVMDTYCGQEIQPGEYYQLQSEELMRFAYDSKVINHASDEPAKLIINNGDSDLSFAAGLQLLHGTSPVDAYNRPEIRQVITKPDWLFQPKSLDFTTSKYKSLYNRKHDGNLIDDGTDAGDGWLNFYAADGSELVKDGQETDEEFQARLNTDCVKTIMSWENARAIDIKAASLYIQNEPSGRAYLWCIAAPDVPEAWGGSIPFMGRGMNLCMMAVKTPHVYDANSPSTLNPDPIYHSGKIALFIKHQAGDKIGIQFVIFGYESPT